MVYDTRKQENAKKNNNNNNINELLYYMLNRSKGSVKKKQYKNIKLKLKNEKKMY